MAAAGILGGFLAEEGRVSDILKPTPAFIVFGGTLGAVLVGTPMRTVWRAFRRLWEVFFEKKGDVDGLIDIVVDFAAKARKSGLVSLEQEADSIPDPYLRKALQMAVDGADLQDVKSMMELDIALAENALEREARVYEAAGGYAPTIGILGAVLGLIQVMKHVSDPTKVGPGIAVAFVATIYGVGSANLLFLPAANKIKARAQAETLRRELLLEGVASIIEGLNPKLIRIRLEAYAASGGTNGSRQSPIPDVNRSEPTTPRKVA
jgi:chemotaxis protein MotA